MMLESRSETTSRAEKLLVVISCCWPKNKRNEARLQGFVTIFTLLETESGYLVLTVHGGKLPLHFEAFRVSGNIQTC